MGWSIDTISLAQEIAVSRESRHSALRQMRNDIQATLADAKADLASAEAEREQHAASDLRLRQAELKDMTGRVRASLEEARSNLAGAQADRQQRAAGDLRLRRTTAKERVATIADLLDKCRAARQDAARAWQGLANVMLAKNETPLTKKAADQSVIESADGAKSQGGTMGKSSLRDSLFAYLAERPEGTRMVKLEKDFDMPRILVARVLKELVDNGKVEKQDKLYFAT